MWSGGAILSSNVIKDLKMGATLAIYITTTILLVFPNIIPPYVIDLFENPFIQIASILCIFGAMYVFGPFLALLLSLVFLFIWSINNSDVPDAIDVSDASGNNQSEGFHNFKPSFVPDGLRNTYVVLQNKGEDERWLVERILKEQPYIIKEDVIKTSAIQDDSGRDMSNSRSSR